MSIISNAKEIADLVKKLGNMDLYRRIVDLEGEIIELSGENHTLKQQLLELEQKLKVWAQVKFTDGVYWLVDGQSKDGPFCQRCYDVDGKLIRLQPRTSGGYDAATHRALPDAHHYFRCFECNHNYERGT